MSGNPQHGFYSNRLLESLDQIAVYLGQNDRGVFIRDYETLPEKSGFDIDILVPAETSGEIMRECRKITETYGLHTVVKQSATSFVFLLIDVDRNAEDSDWMYIEFHTKISSEYLTRDVLYEDISIVFHDKFPEPILEWKEIIGFLKALRKRDRHAAGKVACGIKGNALFKQYFSQNPDEIICSLEERRTVQKEVPEKSSFTFEQIKEFLYLYTPCNKGKTFLYTIQGPDGAGKTTVINIIESLMLHLPVLIHTFHHVTEWKRKINWNSQGKDENVNLVRKILRIVYRNLPDYCKQLWLDLAGYGMYVTNLNRIFYSLRRKNYIFITDRYIEDQFIKQKLVKPENRSVLIEKLYSRIIEQPRISFLLVDQPSNILKRKQELTAEEIGFFYGNMEQHQKNAKRNSIPISINNRPPEEIAVEILKFILANLDGDLIYSAKSWKVEAGSAYEARN